MVQDYPEYNLYKAEYRHRLEKNRESVQTYEQKLGIEIPDWLISDLAELRTRKELKE